MDTNDDGERWDSDEDEEFFHFVELHRALRGPRKSLAEDRTISPEGRCSIEDIDSARRVSRYLSPAIRTVIESPPRLQRALLDRHKWARENLAISAIVGVYATIHGRSLQSAREPRRSRPRCRAPRSAARRGSTRAGPDDDPDPEPPREAPPHLTASGGAA